MMKKVFVLMLALSGMAPLYAQLIDVSRQSRTEITFNNPKPGTLRNNFDFLLGNGNLMTLEFTNISQLQSLLNVDSLVKIIWLDLAPLHDSLMKPLVSRRIDYNYSRYNSEIRILEHSQVASTFKYLNKELVQTKVEQDTLRIKIVTPLFNGPDPSVPFGSRPYFITLILNNISDVATLPENALNNAIEMLKKDIATSLAKKQTQPYRVYRAIYDVNRQKRISPVKDNYFGYGKDKYWEPYVQLGIQYVRGAWAPSTGVGIQWVHGSYNGNQKSFKLYWEPFFFFSRDASDKLITERNDFITFKHNEVRVRPSNFPTVNTSFSVSYLFKREGNYFETSTFKFAVPGYRYRNINLEPEFIFNRFFKNFTPSLKLSLEFE